MKKMKMITDPLIVNLAQSLNPDAVLLYGSYAQNQHDEKSDIDLLALFQKIPSSDTRRAAYEKSTHIKILEIASDPLPFMNGWDNSWSPVNDKLMIEGKRVEIGYNTIDWVIRVVEKVVKKCQTTCEEFPFRPYTFLGLLESCKVLYDPHMIIEQLRTSIRPIPEALKEKIIQEFMPILLEAHEELRDYSSRNIGILAYQFHLFRALDALIQITFVLNDVYDPALKRIEPFLFNLKILPPGFEDFINKTLPQFYEKKREVSQFLEKAIEFFHLLF